MSKGTRILWFSLGIVTCIGVLPAVSSIYQRMTVRAHEKALREELFALRTVIDKYSHDKGKAPQTLQDLVSKGYLRAVPTDPMNNYATDWRTVLEDATNSVNQSEPGIWDVHSSSDKTSLEGTHYAEW